MKKINILVAVVAVVTCYLGAGSVQAQAGVGIMPGKIRVDEALMPGGLYQLPSIQVVNTGQEGSQYELELARMTEQDELQPPEEFISFSPRSFYLEPGANQVISLSLDIPIKAKPGDYLAYIEAHPVSQSPGGMSVGIAVATKLYFTVKPANIAAGVANAVANFFSRTAPYSYTVLGIIVLGVVVFFLRRRIKFEVRMARK